MQTNDCREALYAIPPDLPRKQWVDVLMAFKAAGGTDDDAEEWSAQADSFVARDFRDTWRSIKPGGGIGVGTLYYLARQYGGARSTQHRPARVPSQRRAQAAPQADANAVWERLHPAPADHAYIAAKQGMPEGLKVVPASDSLRIQGQLMAGCLAIPCRRADGAVSTIQFVPPPGAGKKLNLPGHTFDGCFVVGELARGGIVHLCEGVGQAWACWKATGHAAAVCFGWGRVRAVAEDLKLRDASLQLVIVPDVGKEEEARRLAGEIGAQWVEMPEGWPANSDVNDLALRDGFDTLEELLSQPQRPALPFDLVPIADLAHSPPVPPLFAWEGLVPLEHVTLFGAHGGAGKTILMLMLAVSTALGRPLFEIPTRQANVAFYSAEDGASLLRFRLHLVCRCMGVDVQDLEGKLHLLDAASHDPTLFAEVSIQGQHEGRPTATYDALGEFLAAKRIGLLIVDNASDAFAGSEIARAQVRGFMRALAKVARELHAAVILLAHVDKGTSRQERAGTEGYSGSTAWHNSARSRLFMRRESDGALIVEHQKHNLGPLRAPLRLIWPVDGIPQLDESFGPVVQGIADRTHERALLKLIAEYSERGEHVTTATTSRTHAARVLRQESSFPHKLKDPEVFDLLRKAERAGYLARITYKGPDRKPRECWQVTPAGIAFSGAAATAATAATPDVAASGAPAAEPAATAATSPPGGMGGKARTEVTAMQGGAAC